ncbi:MAG TPA: HEAT repeat domain-containing protein, partial [Pyrinomonadaceae bacterium]|nr:HEAT repeat domain-containing protein [Pyrinomonadaceae bacterium]
MRQIFLACVCFILFTAAQAQTVPQANLLRQILDLPAPPPVDESLAQALNSKPVKRAPDFFSKNKVPPDDAPIEDLLEYWAAQSQTYAQLRYNVKPSEKTLERILEYCEEKPEILSTFLNILPAKPEIAETVKRLYDKLAEAENPDYTIYRIKNWLVYHSNFYVDELLKKAEKVKDKDEYVTNQADLLALAQVDWEKALPILEKLLNDKAQPVSATLAKWAFYSHAIRVEDDNDVSKYRRLLQDAVENKNLLPGARDLAFDALVSGQDWDGRDDWYLTLLSDETLYDLKVNGRSYTGLTTLLLYSPPEKYIKAMTMLVDNKNPVIRRAAVKNLTTYLNEAHIEAVRALLPWLSNPNWASDIPNGRGMLITALGKVDLPESVPALITVLMNEEEYRYASAEALARYKDPRAVPALKFALANEKNPYRRNIYIRAMDESGGISDDEKMSALELYATTISTPEGSAQFISDLYRQVDVEGKQQNPVPVALSIGNFVAEQSEPSEGLASRAIQRLKILRKTKPAVAAALAGIMQKWKGRIIFIERLRQIQAGEADLETILTALAQRKEIREKVENEVFAMRTGFGSGRGIAPCLSEDNTDFLSILRQKDADAQTAMLGCARLLRVKLPVPEVGTFLKSANKNLALAAERYLESEDSVEARTLVLARHQGEAVILGARHAFIPDPKNAVYNEPLRQIFQNTTGRSGYFNGAFSGMDKNESNLREEIKSNPDLLAVYGVLPNKIAGQQVIRVFKDKIVFTNYEDEARYREKILTAKEYEDFYRLILDEKVDSSIPFFGVCGDCEASEFVMFGKNGGRRIFFINALAERSPVKKIFERFTAFNEGKLKLHYRLADKIKGLEVLLADEKQVVRSVWKNGSDLRVLVEDRDKEEEIQKNLEEQFEAENSVEIDDEDYEQIQQRREAQEKRREENKYAHFFWRGLENGSLGGILPQPPEMPYLYDETQFPE